MGEDGIVLQLTIENQEWVGTIKISEKMENDEILTFSSKKVDQKPPDKVRSSCAMFVTSHIYTVYRCSLSV